MIRPAIINDYDRIWMIFKEVIQTQDTYVFDKNTPKEMLKTYWFADYMHTFVFEENGEILGTYILKPNQIDLGSHIANASYMIHPKSQGEGIGFKLGQHSLEKAKELGFLAMQFNIVVSTNLPAIKLWKKLGFRIIGTTPKGFKHPEKGLVDSFIMFKNLK